MSYIFALGFILYGTLHFLSLGTIFLPMLGDFQL